LLLLKRRSGDPALALRVDRKAPLRRRCRRSGHVEFENSGDGHESLRAISVLESYVSKRLSTIDKKTASDSALVLHDPISVTVLTNHK
jgi:hypothetical protein